MRTFAITEYDESYDIVENIISKLPEDSKTYVFSKTAISDTTKLGNATNVVFPPDKDTSPKQMNYIVKYMKDNVKDGFLHMIQANMLIVKNPMMFMNDIENMMHVFDLTDWFNTICDKMNYVYQKYNPRISISIDKAEYMTLGLQDILFTSHANTQWIVYDLNKIDDSYVCFSEDYTIPMFYIIEHLAMRRSNSDESSINFMNMYPTVQSEYGVFQIKYKNGCDYKQEDLVEQDKIFKSKNINVSPTNSIDLVLKNVYQILKKKVS